MPNPTIDIIGNVVSAPTFRGNAEYILANFKVASNKTKVDKDTGERSTENTEYFFVTVWGDVKNPGSLDYLKILDKGMPVYIPNAEFSSQATLYDDKNTGDKVADAGLRVTAQRYNGVLIPLNRIQSVEMQKREQLGNQSGTAPQSDDGNDEAPPVYEEGDPGIDPNVRF